MLRSLLNRQHALGRGTAAALQRVAPSSCSLAILPPQGRSIVAHAQGVEANNASSKPDIRKLAQMAQIAITDQEVKDMEPKINNILSWFDQLQNVDTTGVVPAIHASQQGTVLRPDEPSLCAERMDLLQQAPALDRTYVRVPKIATAADADADIGSPAPSSTSSSTASASSSPSPTPAPANAAATGSAGSSTPSNTEQDALLVLDFRVGRIIACEKHPEADSLYVEKIDIGEPEPRTIVSGLVKYVPLEEMQNRMVVVIANLKPRNMRGIKSAGMVLAASDEPKTRVLPIIPPAGSAVGERLWFGDRKEQPAPAAPNAVEKKKLWDVVSPGLRTDEQEVACWRGAPMMCSAGPVTAPTLPSSRVA